MDFVLFQGDTQRVNFTLTKSDGNALDLTGATIRWEASRLKTGGLFSSTPVIVKTDQDGIEVVDALNGFLTVTLSPEDTLPISGDFYHELETTDVSGDVATVFSGQFKIKKALIKPTV
jgi:hypothetical protein